MKRNDLIAETVYKAHINENDKSVQTVLEHCLETAENASSFSVEPLKSVNYAIGLMHDIGKYQPSFQKRINGNQNIKIEHSICGAIEAKNQYHNALSLMMQYCIAGHHSGIPDGGINSTADEPTLCGRLKRNCEDYSAYKLEMQLPDIDENQFNKFVADGCSNKTQLVEKFAFLTRYCFSCLTDADSIDTMQFCTDERNCELTSDFEKCLEKINRKLSSFKNTTELQKTRSKIQSQVYEKADIDGDIYLMNMPTGSGKTLCSMKFALERAIKTHKRRIIYVIPYNSIIDQTAETFEEMFGSSAMILRHQSSFCYDDTDNCEDYKKIIRQATENWNSQIIITTAVQFFESVYANKRRKLRKLHNMANSVIVFDEAHLMPVEFLQPCLRAVSHITKSLNSEAVFLTATMPDFRSLIKEYALASSKIVDMIDDTSLFSVFKKCSYVNIGEVSAESIAMRAAENPSTLIVVNKRSTARALYSLCKSGHGKTFHLSTYMTAYDRKRTIDAVKTELAKLEQDYPNFENIPDERKIIVVSTSLIEAGVDLDFFCVFRELTGLDSVLQAGGRCNREGKRSSAQVTIFSLDGEKNPMVLQGNILKGLFAEFNDISSPECIRTYYERLFKICREKITKHSSSSPCDDIRNIRFAEYAREITLINSDTVSVAVGQDEISRELIENIRTGGYAEHRKFQKYAFTVYFNEFEDLRRQGVIDDYGSGVWCLTNENYYKKDIGITFDATDCFVD